MSFNFSCMNNFSQLHLLSGLALVCIFAVAAPVTVNAQSRCGTIGATRAMVGDFSKMNWQAEHLSRTDVMKLSRHVAEVRSSGILPQLSRLGLTAEKRTVEQLLNEAMEASQRSVIRRPETLQALLRSVERIIAKVCHQKDLYPSKKTLASEASGKAGVFHLDDYLLESGTFLRITLLLAFLSALIGSIFVVRNTYIRIYALVHSRKSCRIKAHLDFGNGLIDGQIIILGKNGCRFEPQDSLVLGELPKSIGSSDPLVVVMECKIPLRLNGISENYVSIFFKTPISSFVLRTLLESSTIPPRYVKKDIMKSNIKALSTA